MVHKIFYITYCFCLSIWVFMREMEAISLWMVNCSTSMVGILIGSWTMLFIMIADQESEPCFKPRLRWVWLVVELGLLMMVIIMLFRFPLDNLMKGYFRYFLFLLLLLPIVIWSCPIVFQFDFTDIYSLCSWFTRSSCFVVKLRSTHFKNLFKILIYHTLIIE